MSGQEQKPRPSERGVVTEPSHTLHQETVAARALLANLADVLGDDEQAKADTVEGQTSLLEAIDAAAKQLVDDYAAISGLTEMIKGLTERRDRIVDRVGNTRTAVAVALETAGKKKLEHPAVTFSLRPGTPSLIVTDEAQIPSRFFKAAEPKLAKAEVTKALKGGEEIPGVMMSNGSAPVLSMSWS